MIRFSGLFALCVVTLAAQSGFPASADAAAIMAKVAQSQDRASAARAGYVYHQNLLVRLKRTGGKLAREEVRDYTITPTASGIRRTLVSLSGKLGKGRQTVTYDNPEYRHSNMDLDGELLQSLADDFGADAKSNDGIDHDLFPLRSENLPNYRFQLTGEEKWQDRDVYKIDFKRVVKNDTDDDCWAGEALIDRAEFQPVLITAHYSCNIPPIVKTMLGTNVQHIGFKVTYKKFDDGVWFPVNYGGEFKFRAVFFYARSVGIGLVNSDFRRAKIETAINYDWE